MIEQFWPYLQELEEQSSDDTVSCITLVVLVVAEIFQEHCIWRILCNSLKLLGKKDREYGFAFAGTAGDEQKLRTGMEP